MQTSESIHPDRLQLVEKAEHRRIGKVQRVEREGSRIRILGENANVLFSWISPEIFRVKLFFGETVDLDTTAAVLLQSPENLEFEVSEDEDRFRITTAALKVIVHKSPFSYSVYNHDGQLICEQQEIIWDKGGRITCFQKKDADSHFYGLGEKTGFLDKQGERYTMWNTDVYAPHVPDIEALYVSIPFLIHFAYDRDAYGIFLDNPGKTVFDMRSVKDSYIFQTETGDLDYYFIYGPTLKDVVSRYTTLTGRINLPPKWAIGYHQSRYSYMSQEEVLEVARTFREKQIPCDVIFLDIHYMDEYRVFTWDRTRFPNPAKMIEELKEMGFRVVPIVDPGVKKDPKYPIYQEGIKNDYFCKKLEGDLFIGKVWPGESAFPDFTDEEVAKWWGEKHQFYIDHGISGIWNDMNEPAVFNESKTMDLDVVHRNNGKPKTHEELHNLYGFLMSKATYEGLKERLNGERPFVLSRAGYAGIQRYAATWTGDNRSYWEHMAMAIPMVLNLGLSGIPFSGPDIGGFAHHTSGELLARWTQMGVFFPYCRNHSELGSIRQEPWCFGEEVEAICREYIGLRYRWMPYLYSLFYEATQTGIPVMRPLILEYPHDQKVYNLCDQFLLGKQVLVAPICRPDTEYRTVYLPDGVWYDYWTGERYGGGQTILVHAPLERLPLFVMGGAILPETELKQHSNEPDQALIVNVYCGSSNGGNQFHYYEDDGITFNYENGEFNLIQFELEETANQLMFQIQVLNNGFKAQRNSFLLKFHHLPFVPKQVEGVKQAPEEFSELIEGWTFDESERVLLVKLKPEFETRRLTIS